MGNQVIPTWISWTVQFVAEKPYENLKTIKNPLTTEHIFQLLAHYVA